MFALSRRAPYCIETEACGRGIGERVLVSLRPLASYIVAAGFETIPHVCFHAAQTQGRARAPRQRRSRGRGIRVRRRAATRAAQSRSVVAARHHTADDERARGGGAASRARGGRTARPWTCPGESRPGAADARRLRRRRGGTACCLARCQCAALRLDAARHRAHASREARRGDRRARTHLERGSVQCRFAPEPRACLRHGGRLLRCRA